MFLFLHSQEGKKCFHDCAKIILRIAGIFSAIQNKSSRAISFHAVDLPTCKQAAAHERFPAANAPATCRVRAGSSQSTTTKKEPQSRDVTAMGREARLGSVAGYELRSICARNSAIEPNLTVPSGSLASIDPSV